MSGGDGLAASGARKISDQFDRTREHHAARRPRTPKIVLTDEEKRAMGIGDDRSIEKARFRQSQWLWLLLGAMVIAVFMAECARVGHQMAPQP